MSTTVVKEVAKMGRLASTKTRITQSWKNMSPLKKVVLCTYSTFALGTFTARTYNDGTASLLKFRKDGNFRSIWWDRTEITSGREAVIYGCQQGTAENFWISVMFPCNWVSSIVPYMVLAMNQPDEPEATQQLTYGEGTG